MITNKMKFIHLTVKITSLIILLNTQTTQSSYSKYQHYPKYCSKPSEMHKRSIPPLETSYLNTQLLQVNTIIRHGARTPWSNSRCWDDVEFNWDCELQTVLGPPINKDNVYGVKPHFLFDKNYDAFEEIKEEEKVEDKPKTFLLSNFLNGTCELGQLLQEGYDQHIQNGKILRLAYFQPRNKPKLNLFLNLALNETYQEPYLYYRSDDMPRTLMSGQTLLQSLFGTSISTNKDLTRIVVHTGDYKNDILIPNPSTCPKLNDILIDAKNSKSYQTLVSKIQSHESMLKYKHLNGDEKNIMDCLMTTICTDRSLPPGLNDFDGEEGNSTFATLMNYDTLQWGYTFTFNNAQYSKLAIGPLWAEIIDKVKLAQERRNIHQKDNSPRMTLYSGHDDTIMPLLATLGPWFQKNMIWAPYASMFIIEIHGVLNKNKIVKHVFRLVYNGQVLTKHIDECNDELCDLDNLLNLVAPFATRDRDCDSHQIIKPLYKQKKQKDASSSPTIIGFFLLSFICTLLGALFTYIYMTFLMVDMKVQYGTANLDVDGEYRDDANASRRPEIHFI